MAELKDIVIVGCGNMGGAMLAGWLAGGVAPERLTIIDPMLAQAPAGVRLLREPEKGLEPDLVLLGVKPQMLADAAPVIEKLVGPGTVLLSILAGVELATLAERFPRAASHVRLMPNLAAALGKSPLALVGPDLSADRKDTLDALLAPLGQVEWVDEDLMDLVTALAGSGPAFVYRFIDALAQGAAALGMDADQAGRLALSTVEGAAALAVASADSPGELARKVASPGGTTQAGLNALDRDHALARLVEATLRAARDQGAELAAAARKD